MQRNVLNMIFSKTKVLTCFDLSHQCAIVHRNVWFPGGCDGAWLTRVFGENVGWKIVETCCFEVLWTLGAGGDARGTKKGLVSVAGPSRCRLLFKKNALFCQGLAKPRWLRTLKTGWRFAWNPKLFAWNFQLTRRMLQTLGGCELEGAGEGTWNQKVRGKGPREGPSYTGAMG